MEKMKTIVLANVRKVQRNFGLVNSRGAGVCPFLTLNLTAFLGTAENSWGSMDRNSRGPGDLYG